MPFNDIELRRHKQALESFLEAPRLPVEMRGRFDVGCRITGQSVVIFETAPDWVDKTKMMEMPVAKATFVRRRNRWRVFWMKRDLRWHGYEPAPEVASLEAFLDPNASSGPSSASVHQDAYSCFWG